MVGQVEVWRDRKLDGTGDIQAEARRIIDALNQLTSRKRHWRAGAGPSRSRRANVRMSVLERSAKRRFAGGRG